MCEEQKSQASGIFLEAFSGLETLVIPNQCTSFWIRVSTGATCIGEVKWIEKMLSRWFEKISQSGNFECIGHQFGNKLSFCAPKNEWVISLDILGKYKIDTSRMSPDIKKGIENLIKGKLARIFLEHCPAPLDYKSPFFAAGETDYLWIYPTDHRYKWQENVYEKLISTSFLESLKYFCSGKGINFLDFKYHQPGNNQLQGFFILKFFWNEDAPSKTRRDLQDSLRDMMKNDGIINGFLISDKTPLERQA